MVVRRIFLFWGLVVFLCIVSSLVAVQSVSATEEISGDARAVMLAGVEYKNEQYEERMREAKQRH